MCGFWEVEEDGHEGVPGAGEGEGCGGVELGVETFDEADDAAGGALGGVLVRVEWRREERGGLTYFVSMVREVMLPWGRRGSLPFVGLIMVPRVGATRHFDSSMSFHSVFSRRRPWKLLDTNMDALKRSRNGMCLKIEMTTLED